MYPIGELIDILQKRAYTYTYEEGKIVRAAEHTIELDASGFITSRTFENSIIYEYDEEERITKVTDRLNGVDKVTVYTYGDTVWKDRLTGFNGQSITYDEQGNPLTYLGHTLTWEKGRQLKSFDSHTYTYNANGIRTSKTVNGVKHSYTLEGSKILRETWGTNNLVTLYDNEENVCGLVYNDEPYYFMKNLQGDVIAITNRGGTVVARYSYDAWGVYTIEQDSAYCIGSMNPYRYRGYYYDSEIGMYYLQSRYYDPIVGRFVNADEICFISSDFSISTNLNIYCLNNPINYVDSGGFFGTPIQWVCAAIGGIAGWIFGDFVARSIGLFPGRWWQWQTAAYWAVRGLVVVGGAVLGYVAGTKLLNIITKFVYNKGIAYKLPRIVQWFLGISSGGQLANELYQRYASHIFSYAHIKDGIRKLGSTDRQIFDRIFKVVQSCISQAQNGSNQIHTYINGYKVTIRFYFRDGTLQNIDAFMGWASRIIGKLIKKW